jgi:hypothetical protein
VEWTAADRYGNRELQGVSEALVRSFSKRTDRIDLEVERLKVDGRERTPRLVKWAVQATRKPKQHETPDTLYDRWRTEAAERGLDPDILVREVTGRTVDCDQDLSERTVAKVFDRLARPDGLTATVSTFARQDVWRSVAGPPRSSWRSKSGWLLPRLTAPVSRPPWSTMRLSGPPWPPIRPLAKTRPGWCETYARAAPASP